MCEQDILWFSGQTSHYYYYYYIHGTRHNNFFSLPYEPAFFADLFHGTGTHAAWLPPRSVIGINHCRARKRICFLRPNVNGECERFFELRLTSTAYIYIYMAPDSRACQPKIEREKKENKPLYIVIVAK